MPKTNVKVKLVGADGNALTIIAKVSGALRTNGYKDLLNTYLCEATSGDYNNLLSVTSQYVIVE